MGFSHICVQERLLPQAHKYWNLSKHRAWPRTAECVCFTLQQDQNSRFYRSLRHRSFDENRLFPSLLSLSSEREEHGVSCCKCFRSIPLHFLVHISSTTVTARAKPAVSKGQPKCYVACCTASLKCWIFCFQGICLVRISIQKLGINKEQEYEPI